MEFRVRCDCGQVAAVTEAEAGARLPCTCGRNLAVPSLHKLREQAGLSAYNPSPDFVLEQLQYAGKLPDDGRCVVCGIDTDERVECTVVCERSWVRRRGEDSFLGRLFMFLVSPVTLLIVLALRWRAEEEIHGRDLSFALPLRLCGGCRPQSLNQSAAKELLQRIELYGQLLDHYPQATVIAKPLPAP